MQEIARGMDTAETRQVKGTDSGPSPSTWSALAVLSLAMAAGGITARLEAGPRFDWLLLMTAMGLTAAVAMRLLADNTAEREAATRYPGDPLKDVLDSAGPIVVAIDLEGKLTYLNPSAERLLGYHAFEVLNNTRSTELLAPGEGARLVVELQKLCGIDQADTETSEDRLIAYK